MDNKENMKNIYQRIQNIMIEVKAVNKESKKVNGQYTFVSHDAVSRALHEPLARNGVVMIPTVTDIKQEGNRTVVGVSVSFINVDNPEDRFTTLYYGYGIDTQDKGIGKAVSYAVKYCLLKTFCLETGDDIEKDNIEFKGANCELKVVTDNSTKDVEEIVSPEEIEYLDQHLDDFPDLRENMLKYLKTKGIQSIDNITRKIYDSFLLRAQDEHQKIMEG